MIGNKLQGVLLTEMLKKLKDDRLTNVRFDLPHADHSLGFN